MFELTEMLLENFHIEDSWPHDISDPNLPLPPINYSEVYEDDLRGWKHGIPSIYT